MAQKMCLAGLAVFWQKMQNFLNFFSYPKILPFQICNLNGSQSLEKHFLWLALCRKAMSIALFPNGFRPLALSRQ